MEKTVWWFQRKLKIELPYGPAPHLWEYPDETIIQKDICTPIGKGVHQGCILSPCLFKLYAEYIMGNPGLDEAQPGIKIAGRKINNLRYAPDTTLMAESEGELKSLLMTVKQKSEKAGLKLNIKKAKIIALGPTTSWQIDGETMETVRVYFFGLQNHCRW